MKMRFSFLYSTSLELKTVKVDIYPSSNNCTSESKLANDDMVGVRLNYNLTSCVTRPVQNFRTCLMEDLFCSEARLLGP